LGVRNLVVGLLGVLVVTIWGVKTLVAGIIGALSVFCLEVE
jgi:hypothetical protein